jgi:hypothetical protein
MKSLITAAACALTLSSAAHADCRSTIGGLYSFAHGGIKGSNMKIPGANLAGTFHNGHAFFSIENGGTFRVIADINDRQVAPPVGPFIHEDLNGPWNWQYPAETGECWMHFGNADSEMYGYVSDDGRLISIVTYDDEMMWGTAFRTTP